MMLPYKLILADDHPLFRSGIKRLREESPDLAIIGEAADGLALLDLLKSVSPELLSAIQTIREDKTHVSGVKEKNME